MGKGNDSVPKSELEKGRSRMDTMQNPFVFVHCSQESQEEVKHGAEHL